jgi:Tfp pilus assembly protein PilN
MAFQTSQFHQELAEKLSREPQVGGGMPAKLLMFSVSIFIITLVIYLGMVFGYEPYLNAQLNKINNQISITGSQISPTDQTQLINYISQITNLKAIFNNHVISSNLLSYLEKNTDPNVYFNRLSLTVFNNQVQLSGLAKSMDDLIGQLAAWQSSSAITRVDFSQISYTPQGFSFSATLIFQPGFLTKQQ